jgi:hypothetical protein
MQYRQGENERDKKKEYAKISKLYSDNPVTDLDPRLPISFSIIL